MNLTKIKTIVSLAIFAVLFSCSQPKNSWELSSPSENLKIKLFLNETNQLFYQLAELSGDTEVIAIEASPLGIVLSHASFDENLVFVSASKVETINESFQMYSGKSSEIHNHARQQTLVFRNEKGKQFELILRAMDKGVAFRYNLLGEGETVSVENELTGFNLPENGRAWMQPYDTIAKWTPAYEQFLQNAILTGTSAPSNKNGWCFPMLFHTNGLWTFISDADLDENYCGMHLQSEAPGGLYTLRFPEEEETYNNCAQKPSAKLPFQTPWRFILVSRKVGDILESDVVYKLSKANKLENTDWIKPGKASWSWWSDSPSPKDFEKLKHYIFAADDLGWEYSLVDANWNEMESDAMPKLAELANAKGIGLLAWYNSGGPANIVAEAPRDKMHERKTRRAEFKKLQEWGVKGIKVDFFQSDKQEIIAQYIDILEDAADYEILVNFHGCTLPRGWTRTYPHLLSMEAVRGAESYKFSAPYPDYAPVHNTIIPFVRNVVGPVDYTPVTFSDVTYPHITTNAHELALSVVFESGIVHFADDVDVYKTQPDFVIDFLRHVPAAWDETKYLTGYPGEFVVLARRKGEQWFIGGINGKNQSKTIDLDVSFAGEKVFGYLVGDGKTTREFRYVELPGEGKLEVEMAPFGGFVCHVK